ncbi:hypothetical protein C0992_001427, partial [Termitomyces sp. T32_za158]
QVNDTYLYTDKFLDALFSDNLTRQKTIKLFSFKRSGNMHNVRELSSLKNIQEGELHVEGDFQLDKEGKTLNEGKITNPIGSTNSCRKASSPVRRPLTRSQTGTVTKRTRPDETPLPEVRQRSIRTPKKIKAALDKAVESSSNIISEDMVAIPIPRQISAPRNGDIPEPSEDLNVETPIVQPGSKFRANLPIPVPNLTKKSRGRRVPTKLGSEAGTPVNPKDATRIYVYLATSETSAADDLGSPVELRRISPSPLFVEPPPSQLQPYYPPHDSYETSVKQAAFHQSPALSFRSYDVSYASIVEPVSFRTNMAVSSLRTEIPQSPPKTP